MTLHKEEYDRRIAAIRDGGQKGATGGAIARGLGMSPNALWKWIGNHPEARAILKPRSSPGSTPLPVIEAPPARETRDVSFWRQKATEAAKRAEEAEHLAEELAGLRANVQPAPPQWSVIPAAGNSRSILILHTSDLHFGEVIAPEEIGGVNRYNPDIARERMHRLFSAACTIGRKWVPDEECDGVLLTMGGDLIGGDIHEELMRTNALTSTEQVQGAVATYAAGVRLLQQTFGKVHVVSVPGNHGRTTMKNTAKMAGRLSYDTLIADLLRAQFAGVDGVTFNIASGLDVHTPIYGRGIVLTHGHAAGTGGGQGFAGPMLPIIRGAHKIRAEYLSSGQTCDLVLMGHFHMSGSAPGVLANGSVVGYSEYAKMIRAPVEPPKQWLARFTSTYGLADRVDIQLETPPQRIRFKRAS